MRYTLAVLAMATLILTSVIAPAFAQQYPNVRSLEEFSAASNFMSLPGYLRWVVFQQTGQWITYAEAERIVKQQTAAGL
ncbi:MAG: hypothetical protein ACT4P5_21230 [Armatimonadota bacterium]